MKQLLVAFIFIFSGLITSDTHAQQLLERYRARLGERDHFNSQGQRLTNQAAIIRQDRANFHR